MENPAEQRKPQQEQDRAAKKAAAPRRAEDKSTDLGPDGIRHYQGSVLKRNADGDDVMTDHVTEGEELANAQAGDDDEDDE